ncbi:PREDICTED: thiamine biosynthetic bifunctional enzyme TH1, chloroplastic isoform X1 [Nelumbo nucifera]|uniref:Thiamine biosynthetic bifunctional enzyme TH1, chloroplastic isoform X1 n=1 Tax=Nelumbo nucifera TaxID=4432 RepID=A0A1U7Z626_NELNU|nr:PREDICTED: thiamine biosynthetic bifunctional enzyme TH1, chloroplastic isoform X1 [Nelumbo nucifera]
MGCLGTISYTFFLLSYSSRNPIRSGPEGFQFSRALKSSSRSMYRGLSLRTSMGEETAASMARQDERPSRGIECSVRKVPHVLTVAGSDSGAGAGIQADLKACGALGVYCSTVITAVTAQNTVGVQGVHHVPEEFVGEQLKSVLSDMHVDVLNIGNMLLLGAVLNCCVLEMLRLKQECFLLLRLSMFYVKNSRNFQFKAALVVDPVMVSTSGDVLAAPSILSVFREELLPMADIVTPNLKEASALLGGVQLETVSDMYSAAKSIQSLGPRNVLVKGGDLPASKDAVDIFFDGEHFHELRASRIKTCNTHGTGCTLASCIAAELAKGSSMLPAVKVAKRFVEVALDYSKDIIIGNGFQGPFDHLFKLSRVCNSCKGQRFKPSDLFLYAVTDSGMNKKWGHSITDVVKAAIEGGATIVQLREKVAETRDFFKTAEECLEMCRSYGVPLLINDRVDVALAIDADGVHIGQSDMPARVARILLGPEKIIGVSCKTPEQAEQAWLDGADYIGCGGVFPTTTKENNLTIGLEGLKTVCLASKLPVVAIGGIGVGNAHSVMKIGIPSLKGVAVVSALFDRECVTTATKMLHSVLMDVVSTPN